MKSLHHIQKLEDLSEKERHLVERAREVKPNAHAPYSHFKVGAAIQTRSGAIYQGCNFENATYGATICAERNAVGAAITAGDPELEVIAIVADSEEPCPPCGICRQVLAEFNPHLEVIMVSQKGDVMKINLSELLPHQFHMRFLDRSKEIQGDPKT